jgi:hypothetical protein
MPMVKFSCLVTKAITVDPLYAIHHRCSHTKRRALHVHGECERPIHQITPNGIVAPAAHFDGGASALTTNQMELSSAHPLVFEMPMVKFSCLVTLSVPDGSGSYQFVHGFYTAGIKDTIISLFRACTALRCRGVSSYVDGNQQAGSGHYPQSPSHGSEHYFSMSRNSEFSLQ